MNVMISRALTTLSLLLGVSQMACAGVDSAPPRPVPGQQAPQYNAGLQPGRAYAGQAAIVPGANDRAAFGILPPSRNNPLLGGSGNDFNWMGGGGG